MNYNKILSNDFIETTFAELRKNGHTLSNLKPALRCIKIILEYVDTKYIEHFMNENNDDLIFYYKSYILDKYDIIIHHKYIPALVNIELNQMCYECDLIRKSKHSPNETFATLFRICYERKNKMMNERIPVMINQKLCWVKHPIN